MLKLTANQFTKISLIKLLNHTFILNPINPSQIIRLSKPAFTPPDISISSDYICNLLKPLNKDSVTVNPYHNTFNIDKAINKLHKQVDIFSIFIYQYVKF